MIIITGKERPRGRSDTKGPHGRKRGNRTNDKQKERGGLHRLAASGKQLSTSILRRINFRADFFFGSARSIFTNRFIVKDVSGMRDADEARRRCTYEGALERCWGLLRRVAAAL